MITPTMNLGDIAGILGFPVSTSFLESIGVAPAKEIVGQPWYYDHQILDILDRIADHLCTIYERESAKFDT